MQRNERQLKELSTLNEGTKVWNYCRSGGIIDDYVILNCRQSLLELNKLNGCLTLSEVQFQCDLCKKPFAISGTSRTVNGKVRYFPKSEYRLSSCNRECLQIHEFSNYLFL